MVGNMAGEASGSLQSCWKAKEKQPHLTMVEKEGEKERDEGSATHF